MTLNEEYFPRGGSGFHQPIIRKRTFAFDKKEILVPKKKKIRKKRKKKESRSSI